MANMNAEAVEFEIKRLQDQCATYRDEIGELQRALYEIKMYADSARDPNVNKKASIQKIQTICEPNVTTVGSDSA